MFSFRADDISGPRRMLASPTYFFDVALPDGRVGHALVGPGDLSADIYNGEEPALRERVAAALNFQAVGQGADAVADALAGPDGLRVSLSGY
jgi:hypothetical protein